MLLQPLHHVLRLALGQLVVCQEVRVKHHLLDPHKHFGLGVDTHVNVEAAAEQSFVVRRHLVLLGNLAHKINVGNEQHRTPELKATGNAFLVQHPAFLVPMHTARLARVQRSLENVHGVEIAKHAIAVVNHQHAAGLAALKQSAEQANRAHAALDALVADLALRFSHIKLALEAVGLAAARAAAHDSGIDVPQHHTTGNLVEHGKALEDAIVNRIEAFHGEGRFGVLARTSHVACTLCCCVYEPIIAYELGMSTKKCWGIQTFYQRVGRADIRSSVTNRTTERGNR